ncbi:ABC transporter permease [Clostridium sp. SYSU_GA19001]|uniref:ABC transporter permease n=1 Tax=Clostridium caldaquaticum TaxID=2940653 RepID=UPI002077256F|nr:ABC transporter permease [Clostridium caldaquaticum]MCM8711184.1 ABC transporter permease [Clostridium caldaquaticum]
MNTDLMLNSKNLSYKLSELWKKINSFREATIITIIIVLSFAISLFSPHFLTKDNIMSTIIGFSADGIITVGMTVALVSGGFDFSAGSVMALSGVTAGALYINGINIWLACFIALIVGTLCGLLNGFFIGKVGLNPFITTLAVMGIARGGAFVLTQGYPISIFGVPKSFEFLGQGKVLGFPFIVFVFLLITIIGDFMMRKSEILRKVFYTGSNEKAAILSGINITKVKIQVYVLVAFLASIAGILSMARFTVATPAGGLDTDVSMRSILAAIIGGASLSGGEGTILGSFLGLVLVNLINNGLVLLNVPVYWQDLINGIILITAVTLDYISHQNRLKNLKRKSNI